MILKKKYNYMPPDRVTTETTRLYNLYGQKLPSVTTILKATQDLRKTMALANWRRTLGEKEADKVRDNAARRGTIMHRILEGFIMDKRHMDLSTLGQEAGIMAQALIDDGFLEALTEVWGTEMMLGYPDLYAGASDVVGIYDGRESIIDLKQANKPKKKEWISDYFIQAAAYAMAHNFMYKSKIQQGVILVSVEGGQVQKFVSKDKEFQAFMWEFLRKVSSFHSI